MKKKKSGKKRTYLLKTSAKTKKEKEVKIAIAELIASSPYINSKRKQKLISRIK